MRSNLTERHRNGVLRRDQLRIDQIGYPLSQTPVVKEAQVDGKNIFYLAAPGFILCTLKLSQFIYSGLEGISYSLNLGHSLGRHNGTPRNAVILGIDNKGLGNRDSR